MRKFIFVLFASVVLLLPASALAACSQSQLTACQNAFDTGHAQCSSLTGTALTNCTKTVGDALNSCVTACTVSSNAANVGSDAAADTPDGSNFWGASGSSSVGGGPAVTLTNPLGTTDPRVIIGNLISALLSIIGSITLLMFIYGGVLWATSMGNEKMVTKGKQVLIWTTIGLAVIAGSYTLTNALIYGLTTGSVTGP